MPRCPVHRRSAFTLTELLVAILLIALLVSILLPSVRTVARRARVARDLTQLRTLQQASVLYAADHDGLLVDVGLQHGGLPDAPVAWIVTMAEDYGAPAVLRSPLDASPHWPSSDGGDGVPIDGTTDRFRRTSYGCNNHLSRTFAPAAAIDPDAVADRLSRVPSAAATVHFLHMAFRGPFAGADHVHVENWWIGDFAPDLPPTAAAGQTQTDAVDGPSAGWDARSNYGFVDGHVETLAFRDVFVNDRINRFDPATAARDAMRRAASP